MNTDHILYNTLIISLFNSNLILDYIKIFKLQALIERYNQYSIPLCFLLIEVKCGKWKRGQMTHIIWHRVCSQIIRQLINSSILLSLSKSSLSHLMSKCTSAEKKFCFFKARMGRWVQYTMHNYFLPTLVLVICTVSAGAPINRCTRVQSFSTVCGHLMIILVRRLVSYLCH